MFVVILLANVLVPYIVPGFRSLSYITILVGTLICSITISLFGLYQSK